MIRAKRFMNRQQRQIDIIADVEEKSKKEVKKDIKVEVKKEIKEEIKKEIKVEVKKEINKTDIEVAICRTVINNERPTIVFTLTQTNVFHANINLTKAFWGLGDSIRGILAIYQFCKLHRCEFLIDIHQHPFSVFLKDNTTPHHCQYAYSQSTFVSDTNQPFSVKNGERYFVYSNAFPKEPLLSDEKRLIRSLLTVKKDYILELPEMYSVLHIRIGDEHIASDIPVAMLNTYVELVKKHTVPGDVICSDNVQLKRHIAKTIPTVTVFVNDIRSGHVGYDTDPLILQNTLTDLQVIMGAQKVYTYSTYSWVSGFVRWVTTCFDIPLIDIKNTNPPI
jgi:hypothetical protein